MCDTNMAALPTGINPESVRALAVEKYKHGFTTDSLLVLPPLRLDVAWFCLTRKFCDCGTALGCLRPSRTSKPLITDKELRTRKKQGWTEARSARWISDKEQAEAQSQTLHAEQMTQGQSAAFPWIELIREVLEGRFSPHFGLMVDENQKCVVKGYESFHLEQLTPELLLTMERNVLYEFSA